MQVASIVQAVEGAQVVCSLMRASSPESSHASVPEVGRQFRYIEWHVLVTTAALASDRVRPVM